MGRGLPTLLLECIQWSSDVGCGLQPSSEAYTHWSTDVERFLKASLITRKHCYADVDFCIPTSSIAYAYLFSYVKCGFQTSFCSLHTSICWCMTMTDSVTQGLHSCVVACVHLARDVTNDMQLPPRLSRTKEEFVYLTRDVSQWRAASDKACSHKCGMCTSR